MSKDVCHRGSILQRRAVARPTCVGDLSRSSIETTAEAARSLAAGSLRPSMPCTLTGLSGEPHSARDIPAEGDIFRQFELGGGS
jgi:hypothetical protein